jgi:WD40 repeat protein
LRGHDDDLLALGFSPDGKQLLSGSTDQTARQWSVSTGRAQGVQYAERGQLVAATPDGNALLGNTADGSVHCWDGAGKCVFATGADAMRVGLGFSADGKRCATLQPKLGRLEWWGRDGASTGPPVVIPMPPETIYSTCSAKGWIMVAPRRSPVHLYDWETGQHQRELPMAPLKISRLLASPNGRWLLAFEWPRNVALCDLETGTWSDKRQISPETVGPMAFSGDNTMLATGGNDNLVTVSDPRTGKVLCSLRGHKTEIKALAFTADGRTLASSSSDGTIHLWHTPTWRELGPLHRGPLCPNLLFTPQGLVAEEYASRWFVIPGAMLGQ